jgi:exosortase
MGVRFGLPLLAVFAAAGALYLPIVGGIITQWYRDPVSSHGVLVIAAAALVMHRRRSALRALPLEPRNAGFAVLAMALLIYVLGSLMGDVFVLRLSLPLALTGCVIALCGLAHTRAAAAPLILLALAIPLPAVVITHLTLPLQLVASRVAEATLSAGGVDVMRTGNILALRHITLEVAEACSGLRSAVSLIAVAAVGSAVMSLTAPRALLLVVCAIPIAVIGNGLRVAATGFLGTWFGEIAVKGLIHELTGFIAFLAMCALMLVVQLMTRSRGRRPVTHSCPVEA